MLFVGVSMPVVLSVMVVVLSKSDKHTAAAA